MAQRSKFMIVNVSSLQQVRDVTGSCHHCVAGKHPGPALDDEHTMGLHKPSLRFHVVSCQIIQSDVMTGGCFILRTKGWHSDALCASLVGICLHPGRAAHIQFQSYWTSLATAEVWTRGRWWARQLPWQYPQHKGEAAHGATQWNWLLLGLPNAQLSSNETSK